MKIWVPSDQINVSWDGRYISNTSQQWQALEIPPQKIGFQPADVIDLDAERQKRRP